MSPKKLKARHDADKKILHDYVAKNICCRPKKIAFDLGWTNSKFNIVYARNKGLFDFGLICKSRIDTMARYNTLE